MDISLLSRYLDETIDEVEGWCIPQLWNVIQPLHDYQTREDITGPAAEIGVYHGKFMAGLALTKRSEGRHLALDVFDMQRFNLDGAGKGNLEAFRRTLERAGLEDDEVAIRRADSMAIGTEDLAEIRDAHGAFSMFSVDGCHMPEHTINDFRIAMELTRPGGIVFVDDYLNPDWPGVQEGLARLYLNSCPRFVPVAYGFNKLFTAHISYAADTYRFLADTIPKQFPHCRLKPVKRFGYDCLNVRAPLTAGRLRVTE